MKGKQKKWWGWDRIILLWTVRDVLATNYIRRQYTAMSANGPPSCLGSQSCLLIQKAAVTGMLPKLDILYVVRCLQMCKRVCSSPLHWELKSVPSCAGIYILICGEKQKKNQRKNSKPGWLLTVCNKRKCYSVPNK